MNKKSSLNESLTLAFEILKRIPTSRYITIKELQSQLTEVGIKRDVRTIQRIMETLSEQFALDRNDKSKPYGYKIIKHHPMLSVPTMSPHESLLLSLAHQYLARLLPKNVSASMDSFFQEAKHNLNDTPNNQKEKDWLKKIRVVSETQPLLPPEMNLNVLNVLSQGLYENRLVTVKFKNRHGEIKKTSVMPLGMAQQGNRLYLVCRFDGYSNERTLAVHRVLEATLSTFHFERPREFDLAQYDADGRFGFGEGEHSYLTFHIKKSEGYFLYETPISEDQRIFDLGDSLKVSASVIDSLYLTKWLNSFGKNVWDIELSSQ
ncbi:putative DNA-binding transcriptional regulator YafY [Vibrio sp. ES.051]|uniref:helix-turn-helix transcriptional regulator n=1 Tax=Vibrio sp. ES.051 TaxID=1761909 RepID=UPI000BF96EDA|nr:WYL domain-containing protein [Vibrio sp. ES.051]PFG45450.1 putative DNA-binding transcriptional regulator YafY [Vibrio sp. ES.051]